MADLRPTELGTDKTESLDEAGTTDASVDREQPEAATEDLTPAPARRKKTYPVQKWFKRGVFGFIALTLVVSLSTMVFMFTAGISIFYISGDSMEPYLTNGESVVLQQADEIAAGQIVFARKPGSWFYGDGDSALLVKRLVAVPGDVLAFDGNTFTVNGEESITLPEGYECSIPPKSFTITLGKTQHFIAGDNIENSYDSVRAFCDGNVRYSFIERFRVVDYGKIVMRF